MIPVLDVSRGGAVHARGGDRAHYPELRSVLHPASDPVALARACRERLAATEIYVADLDAIGGDSMNREIYRELAALDVDAWVDAGARTASDVRLIHGLIRGRVIVGSETIGGVGALREIGAWAAKHTSRRIVFSVDVRGGGALVAPDANWPSLDPFALAAQAVDAGLRTLIVLDLDRVGTRRGLGTVGLINQLVCAYPAIELVVGGGVSSESDIRELAVLGVSAALVGSAVHDGTISSLVFARTVAPG